MLRELIKTRVHINLYYNNLHTYILDEIPTRDLGFAKKKPSSPTITKPK